MIPLATAVACPVCAAMANRWCTTGSGLPRRTLHRARTGAYAELVSA